MPNLQRPILPLHNVAPPQAAPRPASTPSPPSSVTAGSTASSETSDDLPAGYPKLAERMSYIPEAAIFRRFGALNAHNLLCLQAELVSMEDRLRELQIEDSKSPDGNKCRYARNWFYLSRSSNDGDERQWNLVQRIREKLDEYNTTLVQQGTILRMRPPSPYDLSHLQQYLETSEMGPLALSGMDAGIWGSMKDPDDHAQDLVALLPRHDEDFFSKWVTEKAVLKLFRFGWHRKMSKAHDLEYFEDDTLLRWTRGLTSVLASALPIVSITILYWVHSLKVRLGLVAVFNLALSFCLTTFTTAKPTDVFAVAAAFSAVQVVFVQVGAQGNVG